MVVDRGGVGVGVGVVVGWLRAIRVPAVRIPFIVFFSFFIVFIVFVVVIVRLSLSQQMDESRGGHRWFECVWSVQAVTSKAS